MPCPRGFNTLKLRNWCVFVYQTRRRGQIPIVVNKLRKTLKNEPNSSIRWANTNFSKHVQKMRTTCVNPGTSLCQTGNWRLKKCLSFRKHSQWMVTLKSAKICDGLKLSSTKLVIGITTLLPAIFTVLYVYCSGHVSVVCHFLLIS